VQKARPWAVRLQRKRRASRAHFIWCRVGRHRPGHGRLCRSVNTWSIKFRATPWWVPWALPYGTIKPAPARGARRRARTRTRGLVGAVTFRPQKMVWCLGPRTVDGR
jgi:hypothetical protein